MRQRDKIGNFSAVCGVTCSENKERSEAMYDPQNVRDTSSLAWTLFVFLLIIAVIGGIYLSSALHQSRKQLAQAQEEVQAERTRREVQTSVANVCKRNLAACQGDLDGCKTTLGTAQARVQELESAHHAARQRR